MGCDGLPSAQGKEAGQKQISVGVGVVITVVVGVTHGVVVVVGGMQVEHSGHAGGAAVTTLTVHPWVVVATAGGLVGSWPGAQVVAPTNTHPAISQIIGLLGSCVETVVIEVHFGTWPSTAL